MIIKPGDFEHPQVQDLLSLHLQGMHANSPPDSVSALDLSGLRRPDIAFFTAWEDDSLLGCGALRQLSPTRGEIKSMRTYPAHLRRGVASRLLTHLLGLARERGYTRVSLETGSGDAFEAAVAMYRRHGFIKGERFGDYTATGFNQFFHLDLAAS
ncbi:GNAT family N-acetyltransferase [Burkholderia glumae]|uniref:GNAT family N-acetyltransferase n=1 Tax=Burkholderia glumae TaxID=337 RepID=A0AAP9XXR4_BURGL|nr:GNAT family N-acetyltransferase [Burkholderia glumae]ACR31355.1 GCN5-like N-acetyltransferase [Burkholderia glumae BGR1]AJY64494.1 acetyltransferase domain protein [Burkholderia glumae LMG 2196 = ATCC 33617]KHJ60826.1 histone acetyltransferase [Burkholderia glumae]MCM2485489.1 GNAT family N-acetyltransferase [Burkholderia glumae]MCM2495897.1 GNAT family N-acetyltransferase [Burkholderia glumae]